MKKRKKNIQNLFNLYYSLKNANFDGTIYSHDFFNVLKTVIQFSENLHNDNLKLAFS